MELPGRLTDRWLGDLSDFLAGLRDRPPEPEVRVVTVQAKPPSLPFYKRWWFWTLVGVATAGGTAALFVPRGRSLDLVVNRQ